MSQDIAAAGGTPAVAVDDAALDTPEHGLFSRFAAEVFGTFVLVLGIVGTATFNAVNGGQILPVALAGGILVMGAIAAVGGVSGGHFNPAVSLGMTLAGRLSWIDMIVYWFGQCIGGIAAAAVMFAIIPSGFGALVGAADKAAVMAGTANGFGEHSPMASLTAVAAQQGGTPVEFSMWSAVLVEVVATAVFVGIILAVTSKRSTITFAPVVIGLSLGALLVVAWPVTNGSLNPARSLASALFAGDWAVIQFFQVFLWAPLVGGALAALFHRAFAPVPAVVGLGAGEHDVVDDGAVTTGRDDDAPEWDGSGTDEDAAQEPRDTPEPEEKASDDTPDDAATGDDTSTDGTDGTRTDDTRS